MKKSALLVCILGIHAAICPLRAAPELPVLPFQNLTLVDEVVCGDPADAHIFTEFPSGVSQIQSILGREARVLPNPTGGGVRYFAYRVGQNLGLQAGKAYVLQIDYPEDAPRSMFILNHGAAMSRGLRTGNTLGDALHAPYVNSNPESLDMPLAGTYRTWQNLFNLHDRFSDIERLRSEGDRPFVPADGFWVIIAHFANANDPLSSGAAVSHIRLYEAPPVETYAAPISFPPDNLPRRHIFYREEMSDGMALGTRDGNNRGIYNSVDWFENKAKMMKFLGINTFATDLLEFGSNQGFDSGPGGGNSWYYVAKEPDRWEKVLNMLQNYDLDVLPYYEYSGSKGADSLGFQQRAKPLSPNLTAYTHVSWAESARADLADPETHADAKKLLDATITRYKDSADFVGAWFRSRVSQMPMSFSDQDILWYSQEKNGGVPVTRQQIIDSGTQYENFRQWWFEKRHDFVVDMRDHLRSQGIGTDATVLFTSDAGEPGRSLIPSGQVALIAEDVAAYGAVGESATSLSLALSSKRHEKALLLPRGTWGGWEWQHADPPNDPANYTSDNGAMLTYSFNKAYTVSDPASLGLFDTDSGSAIVRHFCLNEDAMTIDLGLSTRFDPLGYFVSDTEYTGPYVVMAEALAVANGNPRFLGYLSSSRYNPGFPQYVRAFNQAFLALPALPGTVLADAATDPAVVVREIVTAGYGSYLAVVNTARTDKAVTITLPDRGVVKDAVTGAVLGTGTAVALEMYPFQLRALRFDKQTTNGAVTADDSAILDEGTSVDVDVLANDSGPGTLGIESYDQPSHGTASLVSGKIRYTPAVGYFGSDSLAYTATNGTDTDTARVFFTVQDTATASDLTSWDLAYTPIGNFVAGRARVLVDGLTGEVTGTGAGLSGTTDSVYFQSQPVFGDFTVTAHVTDSSAIGDGLIGVMVRQDLNATSRMVALGLDASGVRKFFSRESPAAASTSGPLSGSGGWLRLVRIGNIVELQVSSTDSNYVTVGRRVLPGLPPKLDAGIFLTGGTITQTVRGLVQSFTVSPQVTGDDVIFFQDFSASTDVVDYFNASAPTQNQFNDIGAEADAGNWSINAGRLAISRPGLSGSNNGAGFTRVTPFAGPPTVLKMSFDLAISGNNGTFSDVAALSFGNFSSVSDYNSGGASANKVYEISIKGDGAGLFHFRINGVVAGEFVAAGSPNSIIFYLNNSGQTLPYEGPDGGNYTVDHRKASLWVNGSLIYDNQAAPSGYTADAIKSIKFRTSTSEAMTFAFDNVVIENAFSTTTDPATNTAPIAADDAAFSNEGESLLIPVRANDTDPDNGPSGLQIISISSPSFGTAAADGAQLRYTPAPGFHGTDSFAYEISDGSDIDSATVTVTVADMSLAPDLTAAGLSGTTLGTSASGSSRILADGRWEIRSGGNGTVGTSDALHLELETVVGNFIAVARVNSVHALGAAPRIGLMIREDLESGGRMAALSATDSTSYRFASRSNIDGNASEGIPVQQYALPGAWILLERHDDTISFGISQDGIQFEVVESVSIAGLGESVHVGLFAAAALGVVTDYRVHPEQTELFKQDFSSSTSVADYVDDLTTGRNQFNDLSAEAEGGTWSINGNGALQLVKTGSTSGDNAAGFMRTMDFPGPPTVMKVAFDIGITGTTSYSDLASLELGNWPSVFDYSSGGASSRYRRSAHNQGRWSGQLPVQVE